MPVERGNPGRGGLVLRGADARRPEPAPAGRAARVSAPAVLLAALAAVIFFVPAGSGRPWPLVVLLVAFAATAQAGTTLARRHERARVAAVVARRHEAARQLPYFG